MEAAPLKCNEKMYLIINSMALEKDYEFKEFYHDSDAASLKTIGKLLSILKPNENIELKNDFVTHLQKLIRFCNNFPFSLWKIIIIFTMPVICDYHSVTA